MTKIPTLHKISLFAIIGFILLALVRDANAISYGGNSTFEIPSITSSTGLIYYRPTTDAGYYYDDNFSTFFNTVGTDLQLTSFTYLLRYESGALSQSGYVFSSYVMCGWGGPCSDGQRYAGIQVRQVPTSTGTSFYMDEFWGSTNWGTFGYTKTDIFLFSVPTNYTCPGVTSDCIFVFMPRFYHANYTVGGGTYIPYMDVALYYDTSYNVSYRRYYFGTLTANGSAATGWQTSTNWLGLTNTDLGDRIDSDVKAGNGEKAIAGGLPPGITGFTYRRVNAPNNDDTILTDFFANTGGYLQTYFMNYTSALGISTSTNNPNLFNNGGTGTTGTGYYDECDTLDVGCYIAGTATRFGDAWIDARDSTISWLFPDISFTGISETCLSSVNSGSGSTIVSSGTSLPFLQKVVNLFVILVPTAPPDGSQVCMLGGEVRTIQYDNRTNVLDIMVVLSVFFGVLTSFAHKKND